MSAEPRIDDAAWTVGRLLSWTAEYLHGRDVEEARLATEVLLAHALDCRRIDLYARFDHVPEPDAVKTFRALVQRAAGHEPIAYLVQEKEFYSLALKVTSDVLIPRPETEALVELVIDHCRTSGLPRAILLDIGTGSGCISIAVLRGLPEARAVGTDISAAALELARTNARSHEVANRMELVEADRLSIPQEVIPSGGFDVICSNPPYVPEADMGGLRACVRDHEPQNALTDGQDGLSFYRAIAEADGRLLAPEGRVFVEIGDGQASSVTEIFRDGGFERLSITKDRVTGLERVLVFAGV